MSRKFTSLFMLLFVALFSMPALAQLDELNMKTITIGEAAETLTPDTQWYLVYNKRQNGKKAGGYWLDTKGESICYMSNGIEDDVLTDGDLASAKATILVRFLSTDNEGQYTIQFGTGRYMKGNLWTSENVSDAQAFNVYTIGENAGHWGINKADMQDRVDNNGGGQTLAFWESGQLTEAGGNNDWSIFPVTLNELSERELLDIQINEMLKKYEQYIDGRDSLDLGSEIGQYNVTEEEYKAWQAHIQKSKGVLDGLYPDITNEEIKAELNAIEEGWKTMMGKLVKLVIADGNYRIVSVLEWTNKVITPTGPETADTTIVHPLKAMYATLDTKQMKWDNRDETDCRYLWKLTNVGTDSIQMMNIATDGIVNTLEQSKVGTLALESTTTLKFDFLRRLEDGRPVIAFKPQGGGTYTYAHCGGHGGGAGKSGNIVGWESAAGATQWVLEPVDDETVNRLIEEYAPFKNHELMVKNYETLQARGDSAIAAAKDETFIVSRGDSILTSGDQFSSPFTCSEDQEGEAGSKFSNLFDGNPATYWHSDWSSSVAPHTHYFQIDLNEALAEDQQVQAYIARRTSAADDHITAMTVYGANDASALDDATEESWTRLDSINTPWVANQTEVYSNRFNAGGYKYLRFYIDNTAGKNITATRGYAHMAKFQLYPITIDGSTQYAQMGAVRTTLEAALAKAAEMDTEELTQEDYKELEDAVNAFLEALVDPAELVNAINNKKDLTKYIVVGTNPGQWAEGSNGAALDKLITDAQAYLKSGAYTHEKTDNLTKQITETADGIMDSANKVEAGKWYNIRFDNEDNYNEYGWGKGNVVNETLGDLYGNILVPANEISDDSGKSLQTFDKLEDVGLGQALRFMDSNEASGDVTAFRFVAVGDTAFYLQHKSGLYVGAANRGNALTLGLVPGLFDVKAVGLGKMAIHARSLKGKEFYEQPVYLHAQNAGHSLVTWNADGISSNSALFIEPVDENDMAEDMPETIKKNVLPNSMQIWCYGAGFSVKEGTLYEYKGASLTDTEISLAFNKIEAAKAGQPVLYVNGDTTAFDVTMEKEPEELTIDGSTFVDEPDSIGGIRGTFGYQWVDEYKNVVVSGGNFAQEGNCFVEATGKEATDCARDISANTGYIVPAENVISNFNAADYNLVITLKRDPNAIEKVTTVLNSRNDIYTIDGKLVKKNGTISDVKAMGRGLYIIGGAKVMVK